ncbi:MAG: pyrroline-5-carboxylate reductase family protein, partial [Ruminococcus sp.]
MQEKINIGFIGAGNMGSAIMKGIAKSGMENIQLFAFDKLSPKTDELKKYGVEICSSENEIVEKCKYVFLAVKPQGIEEVLNTVSGKISEKNII